MTIMTGRNVNSNDTAELSDAIATNTSTAVTVTLANDNRLFFCVNNDDTNQGVWIKLQAASVDDDKKGIFIPKKSFWQMPVDNIYIGEISAVADNGTPDVFYTEY